MDGKKKKINKRIMIYVAAILIGVTGMTLLFGFNKGILSFAAPDNSAKVAATVKATSLTGAAEEDIISGRGSDAENGTEADVGDTISLSAYVNNTLTTNALILYTTQASVSPRLTAVTDSATINTLNLTTGKDYGNRFVIIERADKNYIKYKVVDGQGSDAWYSFNKEIKVWDCSPSAVNETITVPESSRTKGSLKINVMTLLFDDTDYVVRNVDTLSFAYYPRQYAGKVTVTYDSNTVLENAETKVDMASAIRIAPASTIGTTVKYFYTLDGSLPQYQYNKNSKTVEASNANTHLLPIAGGSISITPNVANFNENFTLRITGIGMDANQNVIKVERTQVYSFKINPETSLPALSAYPVAGDATMTEVKKGDVIKLYVGKYTLDAASGNISTEVDQSKYKIYYTTDGSEPAINTNGEVQGTTTLYQDSGITVPAPTGTLFTIRAFATDGKWTNGTIANFAYTYPSAINSPYATPGEGNVSLNTEVQLKCSSEGAKIYYTVGKDGQTPADPTTADMVYTEDVPIVITGPTIIKAIASKDGMNSNVATFTYGIMTSLSAPTASIASGSVVPPGTTLTLKSAEGATIHYTTDGSNPLDPENTMVGVGNIVPLYGDVGTMITVKAYASKEDFSDSPLAMFVYTISNYAGGIYADIEDGSVVKSGDIVTLNTDVTDATIYYTIDGSNPTTNSTQGSKVTISGEPGEKVILKAIAVAGGSTRTTATGTFSYTIMEKLRAPKSSVPDGAVFTVDSQIELTAEEGQIYYTMDGSDPSESSILYAAPIEITKNVTIKAISVNESKDNSDIVSYTYVFADKVDTPIISEANGELELGTKVVISCTTKNVTMYYTTNGTDPDLKDKSNLNVYTEPLAINKAMTIKVIAAKDNMQASDIAVARFTVREPVEIVTEEKSDNSFTQDASGRLMSRNTYAGTDAGPSHSDFIIKNINYGAVLSADAGIVPDGAQLVLESVQSSETSVNLVKKLVDESYDIVQSYQVRLIVDGLDVEPAGEVELGLSIPPEFENAIIKVVQLQEDGTIQVYETRRSNGTAYANVTKTGVFSIIAPIDQKNAISSATVRNIVIAAAVLFIVVGGGIFLRNGKKKKNGK